MHAAAVVGAHEAEAVVEGVPLLVGDGVAGELGDGLAGELAERVGVEVLQRRADDAQVVAQVGREQVTQAGQQLAVGEVSGGAEQDDRGGWCRHVPSLPGRVVNGPGGEKEDAARGTGGVVIVR